MGKGQKETFCPCFSRLEASVSIFPARIVLLHLTSSFFLSQAVMDFSGTCNKKEFLDNMDPFGLHLGINFCMSFFALYLPR